MILDIIILCIVCCISISGIFLFLKPKYPANIKNYKPKLTYSIIIPARNEEKNLKILLKSLTSQILENIEVIVINDHSTDKTKDVCLKYGIKVIDAKPLPDGWTGKNWACYQGANSASNEILFFCDADTEFEKYGLFKLIYEYEKFNINDKFVLSVAPFHKIQKFYETFSLIFNIIMVSTVGDFSLINTNIGLFGQTLMISKKNYFLIGGHEIVRDKILENLYLSKILSENGYELLTFLGKDTISFRMYPNGFNELINGWQKAFARGVNIVSNFKFLLIILWISAGFIIFFGSIFSFFINLDLIYGFLILYILYSLQIIWMSKKVGKFKYYYGFLFPIYLVFFNYIFILSTLKTYKNNKVTWKGRELKA